MSKKKAKSKELGKGVTPVNEHSEKKEENQKNPVSEQSAIKSLDSQDTNSDRILNHTEEKKSYLIKYGLVVFILLCLGYFFCIIIDPTSLATILAAGFSIIGMSICLIVYIYKSPLELAIPESYQPYKIIFIVVIALIIGAVLGWILHIHPDWKLFLGNCGNIATVLATVLSLIFYFDVKENIKKIFFLKDFKKKKSTPLLLIGIIIVTITMINIIDKGCLMIDGKVTLNNEKSTPLYGAKIKIDNPLCIFDRFCETETDKEGKFFLRNFLEKEIQISYNGIKMSYPIDKKDMDIKINTQLGDWECILCSPSLSKSDPIYIGRHIELKITQNYDDNNKEGIIVDENIAPDKGDYMGCVFDKKKFKYNDKERKSISIESISDNKERKSISIESISDNKIKVKQRLSESETKESEREIFSCFRK